MKFSGLAIASACIAAFLTGTGCAATKEYAAVNGSRSDGTVTLAYEYGLFEKPQPDEQEGQTLADSYCKKWGYEGTADPFSPTQTCLAVNGYGNCIRFQVNRRYACTTGQEIQKIQSPISKPKANGS